MELNHLVYTSMFAAIMGVLGILPPIPIPISPVPITMQTLGVMLAGSILGTRLGPKYAALSQVLFLLLVMAGAPLLSGGRGGLSAFFTPSAGFLIGWVAGAYAIGYLCNKVNKVTIWNMLFSNIIGGMLVIYLIGIPIQALYMGISIGEAAILSLIFLPGDLLKVLVASLMAVKLSHAISIKGTAHV